MPVFLLVFEFLGTTELIVIAAVALLIFGPRKLPEIGRTIGKSLAEFKRASEDFKRTWEYEVDMERSERDLRAAPSAAVTALPESNSTVATDVTEASADDGDGDAPAAPEEYTVARGSMFEQSSSAGDEERLAASHDAAAERHAEESSAAGGKKDWL